MKTEKVFFVKLLITKAAVTSQKIKYIKTFRSFLILKKLTRPVVITVRYTQKPANKIEASIMRPVIYLGTFFELNMYLFCCCARITI